MRSLMLRQIRPNRRPHGRAAGVLALLAACACLPAVVAAGRHHGHRSDPHAAQPSKSKADPQAAQDVRADAQKTEAELKAVQAEIERVAQKVSEDQVERSRLTRELRSAELSVGKARESLEDVRRQRAETAARRAALAADRRQRETQLTAEREALAGQMRAAYMIGREEPLKLLLNQRDPARAGRMFAYYGYFGRARADQIHAIEVNVQQIGQLDAELETQDSKLAELETLQRTQLQDLERARSHRSEVLASLEAESHTRTASLERLRSQQNGLEQLLRELRHALEKFPLDTNDAFARLRGKLAWPVSGRVVARFGDTRAGGLKWDGILLATDRGAQVRAVYEGRVIYADWLPGLGLLTIVDHGDGYMSLYGHNERLYKAAGEQVAAGDAIASAGDSGGTTRPELYFEIRKGGRPVDPRPWFKLGEP
jgi:septal ring factor EnvC (AmiA/AmiB activator)